LAPEFQWAARLPSGWAITERQGIYRGFYTIAQVQFFENVFHMALHSSRADTQISGDFAIGFRLGYQTQYAFFG